MRFPDPMAPGAIAEAALGLQAGRDESFEELARAAFAFQVDNNPVYRRFCGERRWEGLDRVPYLPVGAFKEVAVAAFDPEAAERVFLSSATGSGRRSRHFVKSLDLYRRAFTNGFIRAFGRGPFTFVAHLPRYAEQGESSSLLYMVDHLLHAHGDAFSGYFLDDRDLLHRSISHSRANATQFLLFGAAFGLLDLLDGGDVALPEGALVIETGGMKMRRREVSREILHQRLAAGFQLPRERIRSEYGMCELLSQSYTHGSECFFPPPWVRYRIVDPADPSRTIPDGQPGLLALFDLANVYSVCAVLTEDRAVAHGDCFEVLGRMTNAELRGCNYLVAGDRP